MDTYVLQFLTDVGHLADVGQRNNPFVLGVSGGADSLGLLHVLVEKVGFPAGTLTVAHLNHNLRPTALTEANYVAQLCAAWGVACHVGQTNVLDLVAREKLSVEEAARLARYRFLASVARDVGAKAVMVAHHADDQAETVLMHFLRGSGPAGLRGMLPVSPLLGAPELALWRPLLKVSRAEIEAYCAEQNLTPIDDPSNRDVTYFRNRLRHELLPVLETYNPQIRARLQTSAEVMAGDVVLLEQLAGQAWADVLREPGRDWVRVDLAKWQALPLSLRRRTLRHAVGLLNTAARDVTFAPIEAARGVAEAGQVGAQAGLPGGLVLTVEYDAWVLARPEAVVPVDAPQVVEAVGLPLPGRVALAKGWWLETSLVTAAPTTTDPWTIHIDGAKAGALHVRPRLAGERFRPLGMGGKSSKLKEVMIDRKLPAGQRAQWPIVANGTHLVWLVGHRLDERVKLTGDTQVIWQIRCFKA